MLCIIWLENCFLSLYMFLILIVIVFDQDTNSVYGFAFSSCLFQVGVLLLLEQVVYTITIFASTLGVGNGYYYQDKRIDCSSEHRITNKNNIHFIRNIFIHHQGLLSS